MALIWAVPKSELETRAGVSVDVCVSIGAASSRITLGHSRFGLSSF